MLPKYYLPHLVKNPLVRIKYEWLDRRRPLPEVPEHIQIETVAGCNANCVFCPNKKTEAKVPLGQCMDWDLYRSLVDQTVEWGIRRISPYMHNEPLLDSELPERIKYITDHKKGFQFTKINSNGSLLTERMAKGLLDSGLDRINFSVQGLEPQSYQELMHLPLQKTLDNINRLLELKRSGGYKLPRIRVCMLVTKVIEPQRKKILEYWDARGVKVNFNQLENRGNHQAIQSEALALHKLKHYDWCNHLFEQMYIAYDGRALMCCADWEYQGVMGDTKKDTLKDIWNSSRYGSFRERFLTGHIKGMLCDGCTKDSVGDDYAD